MYYVFNRIHCISNQSIRKIIGAKICETTIKVIHPHIPQIHTRTVLITGIRVPGRDILPRMYWHVTMGTRDRPIIYTDRGIYAVQSPSITAKMTLRTST